MDIHWSKHEDKFDMDHMKFTDGGGRVTIYNIQARHAGTYTCRAQSQSISSTPDIVQDVHVLVEPIQPQEQKERLMPTTTINETTTTTTRTTTTKRTVRPVSRNIILDLSYDEVDQDIVSLRCTVRSGVENVATLEIIKHDDSEFRFLNEDIAPDRSWVVVDLANTEENYGKFEMHYFNQFLDFNNNELFEQIRYICMRSHR